MNQAKDGQAIRSGKVGRWYLCIRTLAPRKTRRNHGTDPCFSAAKERIDPLAPAGTPVADSSYAACSIPIAEQAQGQH